MKIKNGYTLRSIADSFIVVPTEGDITLDGIITLNESGAFLFNVMQEDVTKEKLLEKMLAEYKIDATTAQKDIDIFLERLSKTGLVE